LEAFKAVTIAIIDYGSGNLHSAQKAFEVASRRVDDAPVVLTSDPDQIRRADRVVLPGVGAFADCRRGLESRFGLIEALEEAVVHSARPFFGICVGMQLMADRGLEHGVARGLGWIPGDVVALEPTDPELRIPHMGWNTLDPSREHPLLAGIPTGPAGLHAYFVHSYHLKPLNPADVIATCEYGGAVTAVVGRANMVGTQFHPEKSQKLGLALIENFLRWHP
jgi:glutamine amidotransferase